MHAVSQKRLPIRHAQNDVPWREACQTGSWSRLSARIWPGVGLRSLTMPVTSARMPRYDPIQTGFSISAVRSDLLDFDWSPNGITADFALPDDEAHALRVSFDSPCIVRLLDEFPLSTEEDDTPCEGLVPDNFAYRLEGARFARVQSATWKEIQAPVTHYQFVTGWTCVDVLSGAEPSFSIVPRAS